MKKYLAMFLLMPSLAFANPQITTIQTMCLGAEDLSNTVNEFKELPYVRGISSPLMDEGKRLSVVIFVNPTTGSFTIVEKADDNVYCILAVGNSFQPVPKEIQDDVKEEQEKSTL